VPADSPQVDRRNPAGLAPASASPAVEGTSRRRETALVILRMWITSGCCGWPGSAKVFLPHSRWTA
jgi:hypothetical protein